MLNTAQVRGVKMERVLCLSVFRTRVIFKNRIMENHDGENVRAPSFIRPAIVSDVWRTYDDFSSPTNTYGNLILDAGHVEQRLDLLPQLVPRPGAQLQVLAQIALHHLQGDALLLDLLVVLAGQVTTDPGLQPGHDLAETIVTELLHLTEHTGAEEHLCIQTNIGRLATSASRSENENTFVGVLSPFHVEHIFNKQKTHRKTKLTKTRNRNHMHFIKILQA